MSEIETENHWCLPYQDQDNAIKIIKKIIIISTINRNNKV